MGKGGDKRRREGQEKGRDEAQGGQGGAEGKKKGRENLVPTVISKSRRLCFRATASCGGFIYFICASRRPIE